MVGIFFLCQQDPLFRGIFPLFRLPYLNVPHLPTQQHIRFVTGDETRIYADNDRSFLGFYTKVILDEIDVVTLLPTSVALKPASLFRRDIRKNDKGTNFLVTVEWAKSVEFPIFRLKLDILLNRLNNWHFVCNFNDTYTSHISFPPFEREAFYRPSPRFYTLPAFSIALNAESAFALSIASFLFSAATCMAGAAAGTKRS